MIQTDSKTQTIMTDGNGRRFAVKLVVNGSDFPCDIRKIKIKKGSCGSSFQPGCYYSNTVDAEIRTSTPLSSGSKIEVWMGVIFPSGTTFYKIVTAYVRQPSVKDKEVSFVAEGVIAAKLGREWLGGVGATINGMLELFPSDVNIILEDGLDGSYAPNQAANLKGSLQREVLATIALCYFGYVAEDADGNIHIKTFNNNAEEVIEFDEDRSSSYPDIYDTVTIQGIQITTNTSDGQVDYVYPENVELVNYSLNNPLMTEELFNAYVSNFVGFTYTPYAAELTLGNVCLEPWNNFIIDGKRTIFTEISHTFDGGLRTEVSAAMPNSAESYSRTETKMQAEITNSRINSGNVGTTPSVPSQESDVVYVDLGVSSTNKYRDFLEVRQGSFVIAHFTSGGYQKIPAKYMPAYPVTLYPCGNVACKSITLLPSTYVKSGKSYVAYTESAAAYISPKDPYGKRYGFETENKFLYWGNQSADNSEIFRMVPATAFWVLADKFEEIFKDGEE